MSKPDKLTRKILDFMAPHGAEFCSIDQNWDSYADIPIGDLCLAVEAAKSDVLSAVDYMVRKDLAEYHAIQTNSGPLEISFRLRHEGLHFREFQHLSARERWKERILGFFSGVFVTVVGGLILSWFAG